VSIIRQAFVLEWGAVLGQKRFFRRFLEANPDRVHFAAHSHHYWPDVTFDAQVAAWELAAREADQKWDFVFGELMPKAQAHVARILALPDPSTLAFAPNTHELVSRVVSALPVKADGPVRILTTDGEFHSFARQSARLEESGEATVIRVPVDPIDSFVERFIVQAEAEHFDLVLVSHVFFGSGYVVPDLGALVHAVKSRDTFFIVDGYHGFMAVPTSLAPLAERVFYVSGGYKYAMSGEGACFLHAPPGYGPRPRNTGWFASFGALAGPRSDVVGYAPSGARFLGATFDPTGLHRFVAVMDWLDREGITVDAIHAHVLALQTRFVAALDAAKLPFSSRDLMVGIDRDRGHFLTFRTKDAAKLYERLLAGNVVTDVRGDRLRVGFGLYHDESDVDRGVERMAKILA